METGLVQILRHSIALPQCWNSNALSTTQGYSELASGNIMMSQTPTQPFIPEIFEPLQERLLLDAKSMVLLSMAGSEAHEHPGDPAEAHGKISAQKSLAIEQKLAQIESLKNLTEKYESLFNFVENLDVKYLSNSNLEKISCRVFTSFKVIFAGTGLSADARSGISNVLIKCAEKLPEVQRFDFLYNIVEHYAACKFQDPEKLGAFTSLLEASKLIVSEKQRCTFLCKIAENYSAVHFQPNQRRDAFTPLLEASKRIASKAQRYALLCEITEQFDFYYFSPNEELSVVNLLLQESKP